MDSQTPASYEQPPNESPGETGRYRFPEAPMPSLEGYKPDKHGLYHCKHSHKTAKTFKRKTELQKHLKTHEKPVYCPLSDDPDFPCQRGRAAEQRDMERHVLSHHPEWARLNGFATEKIQCGCGETFTRDDNFKRHQKHCKA
ncbi:uncharacterized protein PG986_002271 [Apiospora aurea]|uniref:C2H2-type domain-containing protein n=1 Tax=Apiospora aurea TaxID=335848 RepID=A0ABR1QZF0_9PEZI